MVMFHGIGTSPEWGGSSGWGRPVYANLYGQQWGQRLLPGFRPGERLYWRWTRQGLEFSW